MITRVEFTVSEGHGPLAQQWHIIIYKLFGFIPIYINRIRVK
jgi:hypothetical protein